VGRDHRDLALEQLADDEAELIARIVDLTIERDAYRLLAQQAIHYAAAVVRERDQVRTRYHRSLDLLREHRSRSTQSRAA
jgi:hypothetical protein